jgi:hypothetical protein
MWPTTSPTHEPEAHDPSRRRAGSRLSNRSWCSAVAPVNSLSVAPSQANPSCIISFGWDLSVTRLVVLPVLTAWTTLPLGPLDMRLSSASCVSRFAGNRSVQRSESCVYVLAALSLQVWQPRASAHSELINGVPLSVNVPQPPLSANTPIPPVARSCSENIKLRPRTGRIAELDLLLR